MAIRTSCPNCSATLNAPDSAGGRVIRCPKCRTSMLLPSAASSSPHADERRRRPEQEEDDRPRKKAKKKRKKSGAFPIWAVATIAATVLIVFAVGGFFAVRSWLRSQENPAASGGDAHSSSADESAKEGREGKYIPHVSEKKMEEFLKQAEKDNERPVMTEEQVYAIMGPPSRRDHPKTVRKNGKTYTVYTAYWDVPGSGIKSQISFANGRVAGMILGLQVTLPKAGGSK